MNYPYFMFALFSRVPDIKQESITFLLRRLLDPTTVLAKVQSVWWHEWLCVEVNHSLTALYLCFDILVSMCLCFAEEKFITLFARGLVFNTWVTWWVFPNKNYHPPPTLFYLFTFAFIHPKPWGCAVACDLHGTSLIDKSVRGCNEYGQGV